MPSDRLRSPLFHSAPKPPSRPPPLWRIASALDTTVPETAAKRANHAARAGWICVGIIAGGLATMTVSALLPTPRSQAAITSISRPVPPSTPRPAAPTAVYHSPVTQAVFGGDSSDGTSTSGNGRVPSTSLAAPMPVPARTLVAAPPPPVSQITASAFPTAAPVDYAARDRQVAGLQRQIDQLDETVRRVRADPHWYGLNNRSTDTSRQQSSDAYLNDLDKRRNDLRRQKWALEGR